MGGQGIVYLGHGADGPPVAVKVLRAELAADARVRERFTKEIAAARRVDPFCIAQVLDASLDRPSSASSAPRRSRPARPTRRR